MTINKFSEYLEQKIGFFDLGFSSDKKWKEGDDFIRYHRNSKDRVDLLGVFIYPYLETKGGKGIFIKYGFCVKQVFFPLINQIFETAKVELIRPDWYNEEFYNGEKLLSHNHPDWKEPINKYPDISENLLASKNQIDEVKAEKACLILKEILEERVLPFYDLYPDLSSVNEKIVDNIRDGDELSNYFSGLMGFKEMVIMSLCNNPRYPKYIEEYERKLKKGVKQNKEKYLPYLEFFYRLKDVLESRSKNENLTGDQV